MSCTYYSCWPGRIFAYKDYSMAHLQEMSKPGSILLEWNNYAIKMYKYFIWFGLI